MDVRIRLVAETDAAELTTLLRRNREFLAPFEPVRPDEYFSEGGQRRAIAGALQRHADGHVVPYVIEADGELAGVINLNNLILSAFCSADLGYWVDEERNGHGVATRAVAAMVAVAFEEVKLHRIQAGTLPDNHASQRVLGHNGFDRIGFAPRYLRIAGRWQDHVLFQRLNEHWG